MNNAINTDEITLTFDYVECPDLEPGHLPDRVKALVGDGLTLDEAEAVLLTLPENDARWVMARLLPAPLRVKWARGCAGRAKGYAASAANRVSNRVSNRAANRAAHYARHAAESAEAADAAEAAEAAKHARYAARYAAYAVYVADAVYGRYAAYAYAGADTRKEHEQAVKHAVMLLKGTAQ